MIHQQYKDGIINALARENAELHSVNNALKADVHRLRNKLLPYERAVAESAFAGSRDAETPCPSNDS